jgi:integrase/recombinase XerD
MRVQVDRDDGVVRSVLLVDDQGAPVESACRFLRYVIDTGGSPNTAVAYGYDLRYLFEFLTDRELDWRQFQPSVAFDLLGWLRQLPCRRRVQQLSLSPTGPQGRVLAPATVARALAAVSSFYEWAVATELFGGHNPLHRRRDLALARVPNRHQPFTGSASRQQPVRRDVRVRVPARLPRPMSDAEITALLDSMTNLRDLAMVLLMLDGGLRPGEVLGLHLEDIAYGRRRVTVRKRDDHPRGARQKSRRERVVDLLEPRTLDAVNRYVLHERPLDAETPFVFLIGGRGKRRDLPLSYAAFVRMFARRLDALGIRTADMTPHALRHTHATAMWEAGMRELSLQQRLGHATPESTRIYTRVSDSEVRSDYVTALRSTK